jgi:methionyl-tRNA formyltransferase
VSNKRLLVFAYSELGHACLKYLLENGENVVGVYTHTDAPGESIWFESVLALSKSYSLSTRTAENLNDPAELSHIKNLKPDLIFSFYYRNLIPKDVLKVPSLGAFNMHGSFLPYYRGRAPVNWAILKGETRTGATLHVMVEKADQGDIVDQEAVPIGPDDTTAIVQRRVTQAAVDVLRRQINNLKAGTAPRHPQNHAVASYFGRRRPEDGRIDWSKPAQEIHNLIRAVTHPFPGAFTDIENKKTYIWSSRLSPDIPSTSKSGTLIVKNNRCYMVCGDGALLEIIRAQQTGDVETDGVMWAANMNNVKHDARGS